MSKSEQLRQTVAQAIAEFEKNTAFAAVERGEFTRQDYQQLLLHLFYQTYEGPSSFALAGVNCALQNKAASEYLLAHAEEENLHYRWVIDDLKSVGYTGPSPVDLTPPPDTLAYVSFNFYIAQRQPLARFAIATVLEGIAAELGAHYGQKMMACADLKPENCTFFTSHSVLDVSHCDDLWKVIETFQLSDTEWAWMELAAQTAGKLYAAIYNAAMQRP